MPGYLAKMLTSVHTNQLQPILLQSFRFCFKHYILWEESFLLTFALVFSSILHTGLLGFTYLRWVPIQMRFAVRYAQSIPPGRLVLIIIIVPSIPWFLLPFPPQDFIVIHRLRCAPPFAGPTWRVVVLVHRRSWCLGSKLPTVDWSATTAAGWGCWTVIATDRIGGSFIYLQKI